MATNKRSPLSDDEVDFLVHLANGNALARQRKRDRERSRRQQARQRRDD